MFNSQLFQQDIERARLEVLSSTDELQIAKRNVGLCFLVEAKAGQGIEDVRNAFGEIHQEFEVEPLFPAPLFNAVEEDGEEPFPGFSSTFVAKIPGVSDDDLSQSSYDLAYHIQAQAEFVSVQPDIPLEAIDFTGKSSGGGNDCNGNHCRTWALQKMRVPQAWAATGLQGDGVHIAHIDTGWTPHQKWSLGGLNPSLGYNFVEKNSDSRDRLNQGPTLHPGHGTHTASVMTFRGGIASDNCNTTPADELTGVAPKAVNVPIRAVTSVILFPTQVEVAQAIMFSAQRHFPVISMSLGGFWLSDVVAKAAEYAYRKNLILLAASGNYVPGRFTTQPANFRTVIGVAATTPDDKCWQDSGRVPYGSVDISAPGHCVWMGVAVAPGGPNNRYAKSSGTSYATANLAGIAALWFAKWYPLGYDGPAGTTASGTFRDHLRRTARVPAGWDNWFGAGIVDAHKLMTTRPIPKVAMEEFAESNVGEGPLAIALLSSDAAAAEFVEGHIGDGYAAYEKELANLIASDPKLRETLCEAIGSIESSGAQDPKGKLTAAVHSKGSKSLKAAIAG